MQQEVARFLPGRYPHGVVDAMIGAHAFRGRRSGKRSLNWRDRAKFLRKRAFVHTHAQVNFRLRDRING
jgi:hypothetical protein